MCDICFEPFQVTHSPISAALTANSSSKLQFGLRLPCPGQHPYCISCLAEYIKGKLDPSGTGDMSTHIIVFPIRCPGCPIAHWEDGVQDDVAVKVLDAESMSVWVHPIPSDLRPWLLMPFEHSIIESYSTRCPDNTARTQSVQCWFRSMKTTTILGPNVRLVSSGSVYPARRCGTTVSYTKIISPPCG